ncbi:hypothetical protein PoB_006470300 [Plakobranchus ocellatus]|uniref:Uncharacterized protein n=1 Tax=Plakobranchus ocellatus TaxID=259542 RepID=A0AAV4D2B8_9GAST|nr:hypothetical protein PoB_006470300 [Plakobranchus ocellatus]
MLSARSWSGPGGALRTKAKERVVGLGNVYGCLSEGLAVYMKEKVLRDLESVGKEADLYMLTRERNLCDQPRRSTQAGARPEMDSVRPREPEKRVTGGQLG